MAGLMTAWAAIAYGVAHMAPTGGAAAHYGPIVVFAALPALYRVLRPWTSKEQGPKEQRTRSRDLKEAAPPLATPGRPARAAPSGAERS